MYEWLLCDSTKSCILKHFVVVVVLVYIPSTTILCTLLLLSFVLSNRVRRTTEQLIHKCAMTTTHKPFDEAARPEPWPYTNQQPSSELCIIIVHTTEPSTGGTEPAVRLFCLWLCVHSIPIAFASHIGLNRRTNNSVRASQNNSRQRNSRRRSSRGIQVVATEILGIQNLRRV